MKRVAFKMKLKPGCEAEYEKRHDAIWPELKERISQSGVCDFGIYLDQETLTLIAVQKIQDRNESEVPDASHPIVRKWWDYMADIMEVNPDNSPVIESLKEMFYME